MNGQTSGMLPYRCGPRELLRWAEERARGRTPAQLREGGRSPKAVEGVTQTAALLGFAKAGELTPRGRELALAGEEARGAILRTAILEFPGYGALLADLAARGQTTVEAPWIEAWWATHGHGSSASNRREGTAVLGRLAQRAGLGRYIPGRRGHPTRMEWAHDALDPAALRSPEEATVPDAVTAGEVNRVTLALEGGRTARLEIPARLSRGEKRRLLDLVDLLVTAD